MRLFTLARTYLRIGIANELQYRGKFIYFKYYNP